MEKLFLKNGLLDERIIAVVDPEIFDKEGKKLCFSTLAGSLISKLPDKNKLYSG